MHKTWLRFFRSSPLEFVLNGCSLALSECYIWLGSHKEVPPWGCSIMTLYQCMCLLKGNKLCGYTCYMHPLSFYPVKYLPNQTVR